jgi:hypothetical protein
MNNGLSMNNFKLYIVVKSHKMFWCGLLRGNKWISYKRITRKNGVRNPANFMPLKKYIETYSFTDPNRTALFKDAFEKTQWNKKYREILYKKILEITQAKQVWVYDSNNGEDIWKTGDQTIVSSKK